MNAKREVLEYMLPEDWEHWCSSVMSDGSLLHIIITAIRLTWCKCKSTARPRYNTLGYVGAQRRCLIACLSTVASLTHHRHRLVLRLPLKAPLVKYGSVVIDWRSGFPRLLESPGFFSWKFQDLESPGKSLWSWKVLQKYPRKLCIFLVVRMENKQQ